MARRPPKAALLALVAVACLAAVPARAAESSALLRFTSHDVVTTWESEGVRVLVAERGGQLNQGATRLAAPRMVLWFDMEQSSRSDVRAAIVRVYAEGGAGRQVRLVEGRQVRSAAAAYVEFRSSLSFVWDCPLRRLDAPQPSALLATAESATQSAEPPVFWEEAPAGPGPEEFERVIRTLKADQVELFLQEGTAVYLGDVHGTYGSLEVRADRAVLWYDSETGNYEVYARGDVRVSPSPGTEGEGLPAGRLAQLVELFRHASAEELYVNPGRARGMATEVELRVAAPQTIADVVYAVRGERAYVVNSRTLEVRDVSLSTCQFARPHYQFQAERAQIIRREPSTFLHAWDTRLQVGEERRTLLWLPFIGTDLTERAYLLSDYAIGSSDRFGFFLQTTWQPMDVLGQPEWVEDWTVNLDYYSDRGAALGTQLDYEPGPRSAGRLRTYYVHDSADEDATDLPVPQENRGRFHLRHRWQATRDWRFDTEFYWLSDEGFLKEYFEGQFEQEKTPESYLLARYLRDSTYLALLGKKRVNHFLTQVEELPSATLELMGLPLGRLVYEGTVQAGHYDQELSDLLAAPPPEPSSFARGHTDHELSLPFSLGVFRLNPSVRALATWAGKGAYDGTEFTDSESRTGVGAGLSISTTVSRVFSAYSDLFDLNRLRHVAIPYVDVQTLSTSGSDSAEFIQLDAVDTLDSGTVTEVGLRQRLQTKRRSEDAWRSVDWVELDVAYVNQSSDSVVASLDEDFVRADLELRLTECVSLHSRDNRFGLDDLPDVLNAGATIDWLPQVRLDLDYDRIEDVNSTVTAELTYRLSKRYLLLLYEQYEFDEAGTGDEENLETELVVRRLLDQWVLDLGVHHEESNDEFAVIFGFGPRGWGTYRDVYRAAR
ncbi:MAG: hypothetical protein R6V05_00575 [Candidatus Brocadiia bacterium]